MLTPAQIIPFLSHDEPEVRSRARRYLVSASDPSPATAEDFWAAADKAPPEEAGAYLDRLGLVPQTAASIRRLLDELPKADPATRDSLRGTLERLDFDRLQEFWDTIRASEALPDDIRKHLQTRLDLANEPAEPLWDRMIEFARGLGDRDLTIDEEREVDRLIEAVSRHPDLFRDRVLAAAKDEKLRGWPELIVTDIAGAMKLGDAAGALLDKLNIEDQDFLWEVAADALVHVGDERVVAAIAERWGREEPGFKFSAVEVLGRIKRPESQAALVQALQGEQDLGVVGSIALALVDLVPDDAPTLDTLRALARDEAYDRTIVHLEEELLTLATMTGVDLPEGPEWRRRVDERRARWSMGMSNVDQLIQNVPSLAPSSVHTGPLRPVPAEFRRSAAAVAERPAAAAPVRKPFKNATAKVGRNDPCPCGSGKKHKKCCGK